MNGFLRLVRLPFQAPLLLVLILISLYLGIASTRHGLPTADRHGGMGNLLWSAECLQSLLVVIVCTMPDLLLRQISSLMASSRVLSLVITLLLVTMGGLYLLHLEVLAPVLILGSAVLLARLDLVRLRVVPSPLTMSLVMCLLVLVGLLGGRMLGPRVESWVGSDLRKPQQLRPAESRAEGEAAEPPQPAPRAEALRAPALRAPLPLEAAPAAP